MWSDDHVMERSQALGRIIDILHRGGYSKVCTKSFDKVVGGLCWAISAIGVLVDVDLYFQENLSVGAKIKLCENIVKALRSMNCPRTVQAHQVC